MFCEKCGKEISEFEKVCPACGENIIQENESVAQPATQGSAYSAPASETAPTPANPKKPMSKKTKIGIFAGAIAAIVVIIALVIVVPMLNSINLKNYVEIYLTGYDDYGNLYNGHFSSFAIVDEDKIREDKDVNETESFLYKGIELEDVSDYYDINETIKGKEDDLIDNLKKDDVIVVSIDWTDDEEELEELKQIEKMLKVKFLKKDTTFEINVGDVISQKGYTVVEPINFSFFDTAKDLFTTTGYSKGEIEFELASFKSNIGEYKFEYQRESQSIVFSDASGETVDCIEVDGLQDTFSDGDVVTVSLDSEKVENTEIYFTETSKEFTIKANQPLTAKQAKSNIKLIKNAVVELDTENNEEYGVYNTTLVKAFIFNVKNSAKEDEEYDEKLVVISKDKISGKGTKYVIKVFNDPSIKDGKVVYAKAYYHDDWWWGWYHDTLKEATEFLNDTGNINNFTRTKILG